MQNTLDLEKIERITSSLKAINTEKSTVKSGAYSEIIADYDLSLGSKQFREKSEVKNDLFNLENNSNSDFSKIMNGSRSIVNDKLQQLNDCIERISEKLEKIDVTLRITFKKTFHLMKDLLVTVAGEILHLNNKYQKFYAMDLIILRMVNDLIYKYESARKVRNYSEIDDCFINIKKVMVTKLNQFQ
jgi:uncharacterized protein (UPF0335 family)